MLSLDSLYVSYMMVFALDFRLRRGQIRSSTEGEEFGTISAPTAELLSYCLHNLRLGGGEVL